MKAAKKIIGATDLIDLPQLGLQQVGAKIDTGAATSALHCRDLHLLEKDGVEYLCFKLYDPKFGIHDRQEFRYRKFRQRRVRSSNGISDLRYSIQTPLILFDQEILTEFTLSFREKMKYPILLGKRFLRHRYIVDVSLKNLNANAKKN